MSVKYAVIFERAQANWAAYVPDLPGCMTTGQTLEETKSNAARPEQNAVSTFGPEDPVDHRCGPAERWPLPSKRALGESKKKRLWRAVTSSPPLTAGPQVRE
jgi:hypothetical protein